MHLAFQVEIQSLQNSSMFNIDASNIFIAQMVAWSYHDFFVCYHDGALMVL